MKKWSKAWKSSKKPAKQRKYSLNAPGHIKQHLLHVHLAPELRKKYSTRSIRGHIGDTIKVLRGKHRKKVAKISKVNLLKSKIYLEGIFNTRRDGAQAPIPFHPSNLMIMSLNLDDKRRQERIEKRLKK